MSQERMNYKTAVKIIKDSWTNRQWEMPTDLWIALDIVLFQNKVFLKRHETTVIGELYYNLSEPKKKLAQEFLIFLRDK